MEAADVSQKLREDVQPSVIDSPALTASFAALFHETSFSQ